MRYIGKNVNFEIKSTLPPRLKKQGKLLSRDYQPSKYTQNEYVDDDTDGFHLYVKIRTKYYMYFISGFEETITDAVSDQGLTVKYSLSRH